MKRFLFAAVTIVVLIFAVQITVYGGTTNIIKSEWVADKAQDTANVTFDLELEFDEPLKEVHGFLLTNFHNTDEITAMESESGKWGYLTFATSKPAEGKHGNNYMLGNSIGSKFGIFDAYAYYQTDQNTGKTTVYLYGKLTKCGADLTGLAILGKLNDGTMVNIWGRKMGMSIINLHCDTRKGFVTINIVLKIPQEEVLPERGDSVFRFEISTRYESFDRILKLSDDAEPSPDGYYYLADSFVYQSPPLISDSTDGKNIVNVRQKPSALYETAENICSTDIQKQQEATMDIEWTQRLKKSGKTVYATGEIH